MYININKSYRFFTW